MKRLILALCFALCASPVWAATVTEDFNCANSTTINCDLTWTEFGGTALEIFGNQLVNASAGDDESAYIANVLTANHYAQVKIVSLTHNAGSAETAGPICRKDANSTLTFYVFRILRTDALNQHELLRVVAGVETSLGTDATDFSAGETLRIECNGNIITAKINGVTASFGAIDDSAAPITGKTQTGINTFGNGAASETVMDDFEAGDIVSSRRGIAPMILP